MWKNCKILFVWLCKTLSYDFLSFEPGNWGFQSFWRHFIRNFWGPSCQRELPSSLPHCYYQSWGVLWCQWCGFPEEHHGQALSGRTRGNALFCTRFSPFSFLKNTSFFLMAYSRLEDYIITSGWKISTFLLLLIGYIVA